MSIADNHSRIMREIAFSAEKTGRKAEDIRMIAVTKFVDEERIRMGLEAGIKHVGENRVQELLKKQELFDKYGVGKNIIGQLQTNKVKYIVGNVELIQSVDREALALEINSKAALLGVFQDILIEVNIGLEPQKGGVFPDRLPELIELITTLPCIRLKGLMCIPPNAAASDAGDGAIRKHFEKMRLLFESIRSQQSQNVDMTWLSMGMSGDYKLAIEEGSNMVRIGTALFGARL